MKKLPRHVERTSNGETSARPMLELCDIRKTYRIGPIDVEVLKGVSMRVERGELVSIMGTSGCGKSTLMHIMGLLDSPTSGRYALQGEEVADLSDDRRSDIRNRNIGFVFQSFHLLSRLNALENVGLPLVYRGMRGREIQERCHDLLNRVGMDDRAHHRPNELSGGQQQRVAIARALAGFPSIILADEPTGALDTRVGKDVLDLFLRVNAEEGMTVVIITHDPSVARECRRCVRMEDGMVFEV